MADPRTNGHRQDKPSNLGPLIIAAGIVLAGVVVAFAVIATRPQEPAPVAVPPPIEAPTQAPAQEPSPVAPASPGTASPQTALQETLSAAQAIREASGDYADATSFELATSLPDYTFLPAAQPSIGATQISYYASGNLFAAAALGDDGTCWWIRDDRTTGVTLYGSGSVCTGNSALSASGQSW